jgi:diguanylate cyclase (GGDEF)-like protein/PAS domain S-box-containing protein
LYALSSHEAFERAELSEVLPIFTETCARVLGVARASVWGYSDDRSRIHCMDLFETDSRRHSNGVDLTAAAFPMYFQALEDNLSIVAHDAHRHRATKEFSESYLTPLGISSMLDITLRRGGKVIGVACFEHIGRARRWGDDEVSFAVAIGALISNLFEISEHERARKALVQNNELLEGIFSSASVMIAYLDSNLNFLHVNQAYAQYDERDPAYYIGRNHFALFPDPENEKIFHRVLTTGEPYSARAKRYIFSNNTRGVTYWDITVTPVHAGNRVTGLVLLLYDVTEFIEAQERVQYLAYFDVLTDLPNRALFTNRLDHALTRSARNQRSVAVIFLDIDRFKNINDSLGHQVGDALLKAFAGRLKGCVRNSDTVAHISGDGFAVMLEDMPSVEGASMVAHKIIERLTQPLICDGRELFVTSSIGISVSPSDGKDSATLMRYADAAMHRAKEAGGNTYRFYAAEMGQKTAERLTMELALRRALERGEFALHFQPIVSLSTGSVVAVEALMRWNRPNLDPVSPAQFIPLLEETGMIIPVGEWALRQACIHAQAWQGIGGPVRVAVNLSPRQFSSSNLVDQLERALVDSGLAPSLVELEITEGVLMHQSPSVHETLRRICDLGCRFSIDDFGTGYSSLSYLRSFPVSTLKIDRSFVADVTQGNGHAAIVRTMIAMAHNLKMEVVAEGVETSEQLEFLRGNGCELAQGYFLARPSPVDKIPGLLRARYNGAADH